MKKITYLFILFAGILSAQTADEIINWHFEATGGYDAWNNLNSILIEGEVSIDVSETVPIKIEHKRPYFKRVSYLVNGNEQLSEGYDGKNAFTFNELDGKFRALKEYTPDAFETDILNYEKKGFKAEFLGKETVNGKDAFKIKLTKNTTEDLYWFDAENYQLLKEKNAIETVFYHNFKTVKGLSFAFRMEATPHGGKEYVIIFDKIVPNAAIKDDRFVFE